MTDPVWTHLSVPQADGRACVMCGESTSEPYWIGAVVGRSEAGRDVVACEGQCAHLARAIARSDTPWRDL